MAKRRRTSSQLSMKFDKRGTNAVRASKIYRDSKKRWENIFDSEVKIEKKRKKPDMPKAAKRASKRYASVRLDWADAMKKAGKTTRKTTRKLKGTAQQRFVRSRSKK